MILNKIKNVPVCKITLFFEGSDEVVLPFQIIDQFTINDISLYESGEDEDGDIDYFQNADITLILNENINYLPFNQSYSELTPIYYRISAYNDIAGFDIEFQDGTKALLYVRYTPKDSSLGSRNIYQSSEILDGKLIVTICMANSPVNIPEPEPQKEEMYVYQLIEQGHIYEDVIGTYISEEAAEREKEKRELEQAEEQNRHALCVGCPSNPRKSIKENINLIKDYCPDFNFQYQGNLCFCENAVSYCSYSNYFIRKELVQT